MEMVTLARHAMATRFELVIHGDRASVLRAAGEAALDEVERLERQLSLYRPGSEIAQLNRLAARGAVQVSPEVFALLQDAARLSAETNGAFDVTVAPLVRCWGFMGGNGRMPSPESITAALQGVGMRHVQLDGLNRTVRFAREAVMIDLGAIGKGYAVDRAAAILREAGVTCALINAGTSTVYAIGQPPDGERWNVDVNLRGELAAVLQGNLTVPLPPILRLKDECLSVSAVGGRQFRHKQKHFGHVLDPRTGWPVETALLSAVVLPSATEADALSTALLILGLAGERQLSSIRPGIKTLLVWSAQGQLRMVTSGF